MPYKNFWNLLFNRLVLETLESSKNAGNCVGIKKTCYEKLFWISFLFLDYILFICFFIYLFIYLFFIFFLIFPHILISYYFWGQQDWKADYCKYTNPEKQTLISTKRKRKRCWCNKQHNEMWLTSFSSLYEKFSSFKNSFITEFSHLKSDFLRK